MCDSGDTDMNSCRSSGTFFGLFADAGMILGLFADDEDCGMRVCCCLVSLRIMNSGWEGKGDGGDAQNRAVI